MSEETLDKTTIPFYKRTWFLVIMAVILVIFLTIKGIIGWAISVNNEIITKDQVVKEMASNMSSQYKRRADLVPQLTAIVGGYAKHEKETLTGVIQARSNASSIQLTPEVLKDPEAMKRFQESQNMLYGALSKLMMLQERYPELKADKGFQDMQAQIEGTENRINVARERYISSVKEYNVLVLQFPGTLIASFRGFTPKENYLDENDKVNQKAPDVKFGQ